MGPSPLKVQVHIGNMKDKDDSATFRADFDKICYISSHIFILGSDLTVIYQFKSI